MLKLTAHFECLRLLHCYYTCRGRHTTVKVTQEISTNPCGTTASVSDDDLNGSLHTTAAADAATDSTTANGTAATDSADASATSNGNKALVTLPPPLLQREQSNQSMGLCALRLTTTTAYTMVSLLVVRLIDTVLK
jgi:hypothetical protein